MSKAQNIKLTNVDLRRHMDCALKRDQTCPNVMVMKRLTVDGAKLAMYRELAGMTQLQLAKKLHVDRTVISHWEAGRRSPIPATFKRLCAVLKVRGEDLIVASPEAGAA